MMHNLFRLKRKYPPFSHLLNYEYECGSTMSGPSSVNLQSAFLENDAIYLITIIIFATTEEVNEQLYSTSTQRDVLLFRGCFVMGF